MHAYVVVDCERLFLPRFTSMCPMYPNYDRSFHDASLRINIAVTLLWSSAASGMQRMPTTTCTDGISRVQDLVSNGPKIRHPQSGATSVVSAAEVSEPSEPNVVRLRLVAVEAVTANAPVALAGVAGVAIGMVVGTRGMLEVTSVGGAAGLPQPGITGEAFPLIGGGMIELGPLLWMTVSK